ncbi:hypothetical protein [Chondromyces apiculatus]|uniref:EVE domain-containing protein n=1 Tax=Chondromyces apiculatus DSM 436 TaxID=1192034 RepID=A0A017SVP9_9BACT|nr:hypothetical protein [Chondromyces apiculatus]EYF00685.1 Hypothetical protein CAP_0376 [Chondromyces apiculatus DSM 436]
MTYWLASFNGTTYEEFQEAGATVLGFRKGAQNEAAFNQIKPGDIILGYITSVSRWVAVLEAMGPTKSKAQIWLDDEFPLRLKVRPQILLKVEHGVALDDLEGRVDFYPDASVKGQFKGFLRRSPNRFRLDKDGALLLRLMKKAQDDPVSRPVAAWKYKRKLRYYAVERREGDRKVEVEVTVPGPEEPLREELASQSEEDNESKAVTRHTEIQWTLLSLGAELGLDVWVARNDRSRTWKGTKLGDMRRMVQKLPDHFNEVTTDTIQLVDVLWLKSHSIVAAFEVECTTSIYSGLLRMSDLLALQPNLDIKLYLVAAESRREKVRQQILRPTFSLSAKPLPGVCGFLSFDKLCKTVEGLRELQVISSLQASFLEKMAEYFKGEQGG